ncbi:Cysteine-rich secretory protein 2 [Myotis brandtii]|uniref:Cysteine-rich secretory protein 2 n=1 Tax=Myotis brandtii TaxID=109478 RepID=S7MLR1_MYOBR|nr:Cysteine-rich secretory protein 2 [Myotis brandtii]
MALLSLVVFLTAVLLPSLPAERKDPAFSALLTTQTNIQKEIVNKHNELRKSVSPSASNMLRMEWDREATANAQKWANKCTLQHSDPEERKTTNSCEYEDLLSNCGSLKTTAGCGHELLKEKCKATCLCENKIY